MKRNHIHTACKSNQGKRAGSRMKFDCQMQKHSERERERGDLRTNQREKRVSTTKITTKYIGNNWTKAPVSFFFIHYYYYCNFHFTFSLFLLFSHLIRFFSLRFSFFFCVLFWTILCSFVVFRSHLNESAQFSCIHILVNCMDIKKIGAAIAICAYLLKKYSLKMMEEKFSLLLEQRNAKRNVCWLRGNQLKLRWDFWTILYSFCVWSCFSLTFFPPHQMDLNWITIYKVFTLYN